jgi:hypothetical protein
MSSEFAAVRAVAGRYVVASGHFAAGVERLVESNARFDVVEAR